MEERRNKELIRKIAQGDEAAFTSLYEENRRDIFAFALSILKNYHDAEDVMQEVLVKVKLQAGSCKNFENINGWLIRVTKNASFDLLRKKKEIIDEELAMGSAQKGEESTIADHSIFIGELFDELKDEERQIVALHLISDLTHRTIAKALNLPLTTVKWRYRKAILHLKRISKEREWTL